MNAGRLDRRLQVSRFIKTGDDAFGSSTGSWQNVGPVLFAGRKDISDAERLGAGVWDNLLVTRFTIRATEFGRTIRRTDRVIHEGFTFEISGIKEVPGGRGYLEITAKSAEAP